MNAHHSSEQVRIIPLSRQCRECGNIKLASEFYPEKRNNDGLDGNCKQCRKRKLAKYRSENKARIRISRDKWNAKNPKKMQKLRDSWKERNPDKWKSIRNRARKFSSHEKRKNQGLKYKYGITLETFLAIYNAQDGRCAICKKELEKFDKKTCMDHSHKTGSVRGILCTACNFGIGAFGEKEENLLSAISYLSKYRCE